MTKVVGLILKSKKEATSPDMQMKLSATAKQKQDSPKVVTLTSKGFERHRVKHDYHDYAKIMEFPSQLEMDIAAKASGGVNNPFPSILHRLLSESDLMGFSHLVSWQSHGRSFLIHKPREFVREVVPRYFKHSKLASFQRQLSLYGFVRLTNEGPDKGAYYHELFLRGRPFLCSKIQRTRVKGTWVRTSSSPESEPDFFSMEPVQDLEELVGSSSQSLNYTSSSETCLGEASQDEDGVSSANFVTPKSSPYLRGDGKFDGSLQQSLSLEEFNLDTSLLRGEQVDDNIDVKMGGPISSTFGLDPPPSLPKLVIETPTSSGDERTQDSDQDSSHQSLSTTTLPSLIKSSDICETEGVDNSSREIQLSLNQKRISSEIPSLARLGKALSTSDGMEEEDDELRKFLRDVDLGFELEMVEEILQSSIF